MPDKKVLGAKHIRAMVQRRLFFLVLFSQRKMFENKATYNRQIDSGMKDQTLCNGK